MLYGPVATTGDSHRSVRVGTAKTQKDKAQ
jgi:hypothetical protein